MAQAPLSHIFRHITQDDGLASNRIFGILRDDKGFMWISTQNGLQRYDGNSFITWHHNPADTNSLPTDASVCKVQDADRNLWLCSWPWGFTVFNPQTEKFRRNFVPNVVNALNACMDKDSNVWLVSGRSLEEYQRSTGRVISYREQLPPDIDFYRSILFDPLSGRLYINSGRYGICIFDPAEKKFYYRLNNPHQWPMLKPEEHVGTILLDRENGLWANTFSGKLIRYDLLSGKVTRFLLREPGVAGRFPKDEPGKVLVGAMLEDRWGNFWFASGSDVLHVRLDGPPLLDAVHENAADVHGFHSGGGVNCLYEDPEGDVWIGTDAGIDIINPGTQRFVSVPLIAPDASGVKRYSVLNFLERDNGDIWVGTYYGGIFVFDKSLRLKTRYLADDKNPANPHRLPIGAAWSFLQLPGGRIAIGSQRGWLSLYDPTKGTFDNRRPEGLHQLTIANMLPGGDGNIWMALYRGLGKWDPRTDSFSYYPDFIPYRGDTSAVALDLIEDRQQHIRVATFDHGLQEFLPAVGKFVATDTPRGRPGSISSAALQSIIRVGDTLLAMGTADAGINLCHLPGHSWSYITAVDGLPTNNVTALYFQPPGSLWAATAQGLCRVDLATRHVTTYGLEDGIAGDDFSDLLRFYRLRDGRLLAGYKGGIVAFNPDSLVAHAPPREVTLTGIRVFEQSLSVDSVLHGSNTARFSYRQNFISIQYSSLSYTDPGTRYYYQLEGIDPDWVDAGQSRVASYTNLPDGRYLFKVKCENDDRVPCRNITSLHLIIVPPFWRTGWFYGLVIALIGGLLYVLYRYRIGQILAMQAMRNKISKDLHDDLGATLSSIAVLSEIARNSIQRGSPQQSFPMLEKISTYSRDMVDKMRDIVWAINPSNDSLENIVKRLQVYSTEACGNRGIQFCLQLKDDFVNQAVPMSTRKNLYLICKEAIHNAIIHSDCSRILALFDASAGFIHVTIADDGKGFDPAGHVSGNGLNNMRSRAEEIRASLEIICSEPGTVVELRLAVPKIRS
jgi:ligand-binding sensor domain-containing protein